MTEGLTSPVELQRRLQAEARGAPFLVLHGLDGERLFALEGLERVAVGRGPDVDLALDPDAEVSRLHAELEQIASRWVLADDGLSSNGSYVNGDRVGARTRLRDGDVLHFGATEVRFRAPAGRERTATAKAEGVLAPSCRRPSAGCSPRCAAPSATAAPTPSPPPTARSRPRSTSAWDAVKSHLRVLFEKLQVAGYAQNEKRLRLVERAFRSGAISRRDLD